MFTKDQIIKKWQNSDSQDPFFIESLKKIIKSKTPYENFSKNLEFIDGKIKSKLGVGTQLLNEYTISSIGESFSLFCQKNNLKNILVSHDGSFHSILFAKVFSSRTISNEINAYFLPNNQATNDSLAIWIANNNNNDIKFDFVVTFSSMIEKDFFEISFFDSLGRVLNFDNSEEINAIMGATNYLNVSSEINDVPQLKEIDFTPYKKTLKSNKDLSNLKITVSNPFNFNNDILGSFFHENKISAKQTKFKQRPTKMNVISKKSILNSIKNKSDATINFLDGSNKFELWIKHKKRRKLISMNEMALVYLYYKINFSDFKADCIHKNVITNYKGSEFIDYYAKKNNINIIKHKDFFSSFTNASNSLDNLLMATDGDGFFINEQTSSFVSDPLNNIRIFLELISFFKSQGKSIYDVLMDIYQAEKMYRYSQKVEQMDNESAMIFFNKLKRQTHINNTKIIRFQKLDKKQTAYELKLENKTTIWLEYSSEESVLRTYFSCWQTESKTKLDIKKQRGKNENEYIQLIVREKEILNSINEFKEKFDVKKFSWKALFKYSFFVLLFVGFFAFIFIFIFQADVSLFKQIGLLFKENKTFAYLIPILSFAGIFHLLLNSWVSYRILKIMGHKIKIRHMIVSSLISICVSNITPLVYGGESVSYWYLRRKGFPRAPLASMFLVQSLLFQINLVLFSLVFIPIGFMQFFPEFLKNLDANFLFLIILIVAGFIMDIFAAVMIGLLTFNYKIQNKIARTLNKFIEWIPFIVSRDPVAMGAQMEYEFGNVRKSSKKIFTSREWYLNILIFVELLFYKSLASLISWVAIVAIIGDFIKPEYSFIGSYVRILAGQSLIRCVNALNFVIPGGLGVSDWAAKNILVSMFVDSANSSKPVISEYRNINVWQTLTRIMYTIVWVIASAFALFTVYIGESRIDKYNKIKNTLTTQEIDLGKIKTKTTFYKQAIFYWAFGIAGFIVAWAMILKFVIFI